MQFTEFLDANTSPSTPAAFNRVQTVREEGQTPLEPTNLCRWAIHTRTPYYEAIPSPPESQQEEFDLNDTDNWPAWNEEAHRTHFVDRLQEALQSNSFSSIEAKDLPLSITRVALAAKRSKPELLAESVGFAIMAHNEELIVSILAQNSPQDLDLTQLSPFHLAASYTDGTKACCNILWTLTCSLAGRNSIMNLYVNNLGYTVLDSLMISIIKAHTSCTPRNVDSRFGTAKRFVGEDIDICGRWDADSPCIRALNGAGIASIPFTWKHMFCHTSVQAICHSIIAIFCAPWAPGINTPSGLFTKTCGTCGKKLELLPLHTLVLVAFYLAQNGCEGESLFGALACLACLLAYGANPLEKAEISVEALLGTDDGDHCSHAPLDPVELAKQVPQAISATWTEDVRLGWEVFLGVLRFAQQERNHENRPEPTSEVFGLTSQVGLAGFSSAFEVWGDEMPIDSEEEDDDTGGGRCEHWGHNGNFYGGSKELGILWAAIQTEFLTYRRLNDADSWLSEHFSMKSVVDGLTNGLGFGLLPLVEREMMKPYCRCGRFLDAESAHCCISEEACSFYFSNLEDWQRSTFLPLPCLEGDIY